VGAQAYVTQTQLCDKRLRMGNQLIARSYHQAGINLNVFGALAGAFSGKSTKETAADGSSVEYREDEGRMKGVLNGLPYSTVLRTQVQSDHYVAMLSPCQVLGKGVSKRWEQLKERRRGGRCGRRSRESRGQVPGIATLRLC